MGRSVTISVRDATMAARPVLALQLDRAGSLTPSRPARLSEHLRPNARSIRENTLSTRVPIDVLDVAPAVPKQSVTLTPRSRLQSEQFIVETC